MLRINKLAMVGAVASLGLVVACSGDDDTNNTTNNNSGFEQPANTTPLSFCADDSVNKTYEQGEIFWKGSFTYDENTRILTHDPSWGGGTGPYPQVYDDGPWNMGGHEPAGQTAGDNVWCVTAFVETPAEDLMFEYGAENQDGGWIWVGTNGAFTLPAGSTDEIIADPLVIEPFGTIDLRLTVDTSTLAEDWIFNPAEHEARVKGSKWAWTEVTMTDDGSAGDATADDGIYTFMMSEHVGSGALKNFGLLKPSDQAEFVFVLRGVEYKGDVEGENLPLTQGVAAEISRDEGATWDAIGIEYLESNGNTYVSPGN